MCVFIYINTHIYIYIYIHICIYTSIHIYPSVSLTLVPSSSGELDGKGRGVPGVPLRTAPGGKETSIIICQGQILPRRNS